MHNHTLPGENEKALMFVLANRAMAHAYLGLNEKKEMLELATMVIIYDHGYQKVKGIGGLTRTWARRLVNAFVSRADQYPLKAKHKGRTAYTDKLERAWFLVDGPIPV